MRKASQKRKILEKAKAYKLTNGKGILYTDVCWYIQSLGDWKELTEPLEQWFSVESKSAAPIFF